MLSPADICLRTDSEDHYQMVYLRRPEQIQKRSGQIKEIKEEKYLKSMMKVTIKSLYETDFFSSERTDFQCLGKTLYQR